MMRRNRSRAAALLLMAALAACSDAPTGATITAANQPAALNTAPTLTITNSGGYPLVSWNATSGAVSYRVDKLFYMLRQGRTGTYYTRHFINLTTTTGTSYLDTAHAYTGVHYCTNEDGTPGNFYEYGVTTTFSDGTTTLSRHYAPIAGWETC